MFSRQTCRVVIALRPVLRMVPITGEVIIIALSFTTSIIQSTVLVTFFILRPLGVGGSRAGTKAGGLDLSWAECG